VCVCVRERERERERERFYVIFVCDKNGELFEIRMCAVCEE